ncbi:MAG: sulfite exporter TauE/SafE family protein [Gemmatimonadota bacterium]
MNPLYLAIGLTAGVLSGLFGIGGGVIIVTALVQLARLPIKTALGTSLGAMLLPVGLFGAMEYYRTGNLDLKAALILALGLALGAWFGARVAQGLEPRILQRMFSVFLMFMAVRLWVTA